MGWTGIHYYGQKLSDLLREEIDNTKYLIIETSTKGSTVYAAAHDIERGGCFAIVMLTSRSDKEIRFKIMTENEGPHYYGCPEKILNLLTPTDNPYAQEWRSKVWNVIEQRKAMKSGEYIKTKEPIRFNNGQLYQYFKKIRRRMYAGRVNEQGKFVPGIRVRVSVSTLASYGICETE